jgi:GAF domain-containing protein/HAMP domain-containing protein
MGKNPQALWERLKAPMAGMRGGGLGARIVWWSFLPTALILAAVAGAAFIFYLQAAEDLAVEQNKDLAHYAAGQLASELEDHAETLEEIARAARLGDLRMDQWEGALKDQANRLVVFDGGALALDGDGSLVAAQPARPDLGGADLSDRAYFRSLVRTVQPVITDAVGDGPGGARVVAIAVPIRGQGEATQGVLVGMFRLGETAVSAFYGDILKLRAGGEGHAYLVDGQGRVLFHSDPARILSDMGNRTVVRKALEGEAGATRTTDERGEDVLASYAPVPETAWGLIVEKDWSQVVAPIRSRELLMVLLLVLGVVVPGAIVSMGVRAITRPIVELVEAAENIARGEYAQPASADVGGELGQLATQFNRVSVQLREAQGDLERKVEARTHELSMLLEAVQGASGSLELEQVLEEIADSLAEAAGVPNCGIFLMDEESRLFHSARIREISEYDASVLKLPESVDPDQDRLARRVITTGRPVVSVPGDEVLGGQSGLQSILEIPLVSKGTVVALAILGTEDAGHEFAPEEIDLAWGIASTAAVAIENARLFERLELKLRELESVYQADAELHRHLDLDGVLGSLVDVSVDILKADKSSIMVWDEEEGALKVRAARGFSRETMARMTFHSGEGAVSRVLSERQPVLVEDTHRDDRVARYVTDPEGIRAFIHIPIEIGQHFFGVFNLNYLRPRQFPEDEVRLFTSLAQRAALAIENARPNLVLGLHHRRGHPQDLGA